MFKIISVFIFYSFLIAPVFSWQGKERSGPVKIEVSSYGDYVVSSHRGRFLVLWDIDKKESFVISRYANIYSPYFIPDTPYFIWQDEPTKVVHITHTSNTEIGSLDPGVAVFSQIMSTDLKNYLATDNQWNLYAVQDGMRRLKQQGQSNINQAGKLLDLSYQKNLVALAGICQKGQQKEKTQCLSIWDIKKEKQLYQLEGHVGRTIAVFSPEGKYLVSGDEENNIRLWTTKKGALVYQVQLAYRKRSLIAIKFIDENYFLAFREKSKVALLFNLKKATPVKKLTFPVDALPDIQGSAAMGRIATAPYAGILAMPQFANKPYVLNDYAGINVYYFDVKTKRLSLLWSTTGPVAHKPLSRTASAVSQVMV